MKTLLVLTIFAVSSVARSATDSPSWDELCYLLEVKKESKVFHDFSIRYDLHEFAKCEGSYSGKAGVMLTCVGDDIVIVGVRVSEATMTFPYGLRSSDDPLSASRKVGARLTEDQKARMKEYLEVLVPEKHLVLYFMQGRLFEVWKQKPNKPVQSNSVDARRNSGAVTAMSRLPRSV